VNASIAIVVALAANPHATAAEEAFRRGDYAAAVDALERAYAVEADPALLFARGSALQKLERYDDAIEAYTLFLATNPKPDKARKARKRITECEASLDTRRSPEPPPPVVQAPPATEVPVDDTPRPRPWHRDPLAGALVGSGAAFAIAGGVLIGLGARRRGDADSGATEEAFRDELRSSNTMQGVGIGVAVSGGLLVTGAILRYAQVRRLQSNRGDVALRF